jgi:hypothetical protein
MFGIAISSLMYKIMGSKNLPRPFEMPLFVANDFANPENNKNIKIATSIIVATFFVIEKSRGVSFNG